MNPWPMCNQLPILGWIFNSPRVKNPSGLHKHRTDNSNRRNRGKVRNRIFENYLVVFMFFSVAHVLTVCLDQDHCFVLLQTFKAWNVLSRSLSSEETRRDLFKPSSGSHYQVSLFLIQQHNCNIFMLVAITDCSTSKTYLRWQFFLLVELVKTLGVSRIKIEILDGVTNNWFSIFKI